MDDGLQTTRTPPAGIRKAATDIEGLDEVLDGGLPAGRPTLICGAAGCGKTLFGLQFLVRGAVQLDEPGEGKLTRHGLEEYVSDCVIVLDHRLADQVSTRRLRVVKHRGSTHGTNEYPFLIDRDGVSVLPITSTGLDHQVSDERVSTGVPRLDTMLGGEGYYRGSTVLVSGTAGVGKSTLAAHFADATCSQGERDEMAVIRGADAPKTKDAR